MKCIAFIFARGGSKGVPQKNIRHLAGKPLLAYPIQTAQAVSAIEQIIVSTDDEQIATLAKHYGANVPFIRPAHLAEDDSPEWLAWQHAIRFVQEELQQPFDVFLSLPTTAPLRAAIDVERCIDQLLTSKADVVISVTEAARNPYFNMVQLDRQDNAQLIMQPQQTIEFRQHAPQAYDMSTVAYVARPDFILRANALFDGQVKTVQIPRERAIDIDDELDFKFAEFLLERTDVMESSL